MEQIWHEHFIFLPINNKLQSVTTIFLDAEIKVKKLNIWLKVKKLNFFQKKIKNHTEKCKQKGIIKWQWTERNQNKHKHKKTQDNEINTSNK